MPTITFTFSTEAVQRIIAAFESRKGYEVGNVTVADYEAWVIAQTKALVKDAEKQAIRKSVAGAVDAVEDVVL